ncbi:MAG: GDSL-type esterase/lipase family protein, partial [Clostridia bacterium]|nr:GDSL-type esterase/lipase family protein [Clostridia bacterium]
EYVAAAVTACRAALDGRAPDLDALQAVFSRSGFTDEYLTGRRSVSMYGFRRKEDVTAAAPVLVNAGISGDNAVNGLKRLERDVLRFRPDAVVVNFGLNDSTNPDVEGGCRQYAQAMRTIFQRVRETGAECILLTPNHMCRYLLPEVPDGKLREAARACMISQNDGILSRYVAAARLAARETGAVVADAYAKWDALERAGVDTTRLLSNWINHPTVEMHGLFVEALMEAMLAGAESER